ncbi:MAG: citrate transporter [Clostridia bacterium]|nr:citrate transporter [Clostridia bacterium]
MKKVLNFVKNEIVLVISFVLASVSCFIVTPDKSYIEYIDFKTLVLLFCLMAVTSGLGSMGVFRVLAEKMLKRVKSFSLLSLTLCLLCFFSSMLITNDVALITFVPFTLIILNMINKKEKAIILVTLETVAANLGSMATPIGNPQNLYLFSKYEMSMGDFFSAILPYAFLSLVLVVVCSLFLGKEKIEINTEKTEFGFNIKIIIYAVLFVLSLLSVFRVVDYRILLAVSVVSVLICDRKTFRNIDYSLLLTFVFLFVFIGNLGRIEIISEFLRNTVSGREIMTGIISSQVFSNVPAAILLSNFTDNVKDLLIGVNLGGLGTLIASMASLISFKLIQKEKVNTGKYMLVFTLVNIAFLGANLLLTIV